MKTRSWKKSHQPTEQDFELNIAAIIDCFVVLIAFLLISTSFVAVGIIDAEVGAAGEEQIEDTLAAPIQVTIQLKANHNIEVHVRGEVSKDFTLNAQLDGGSKKWDHVQMVQHLTELKSEWPQLKSAVLLADNDVSYEDIVQSLSEARSAQLHIALGGFE